MHKLEERYEANLVELDEGTRLWEPSLESSLTFTIIALLMFPRKDIVHNMPTSHSFHGECKICQARV